MNAICQQVADAYLLKTPADFEEWLAKQAADNPGTDWSLCRSGHLAGRLNEAWARDNASPDILAM